MPLWTIHHTPGIFTDEEKHQLALRITDHHQRNGLPGFYVITIFNETRPEDFYVGGKLTPVGVRILIDHIARHTTDKESREQIARWIKRILHPYMEKHEGLHWEFHADETSEELWMINGLVPPPGRFRGRKSLGDSQRRVSILRRTALLAHSLYKVKRVIDACAC